MDTEYGPGFNGIHRLCLGHPGHTSVGMSQKERPRIPPVPEIVLRLEHGPGHWTMDIGIEKGHVCSSHIVRMPANIPCQQKGNITQIMIRVLFLKGLLDLNLLIEVSEPIFQADTDSANPFFQKSFELEHKGGAIQGVSYRLYVGFINEMPEDLTFLAGRI